MSTDSISTQRPESPISQQERWVQFRQAMPVSQSWAYFDHAAVGPLPFPSHQAISEWTAEATYLGDTVWPKWNRRVDRLRRLASELINATPDEVAIVPNTTAGINLVAHGLEWQAGDNIVIPAGEFPSNLFPWMALESQGVELRVAPVGGRGEVELDNIAARCDARTKLIAASWVGFASGYRLDVGNLAQLAHDRGALFFLDAIQGLGVFSLDVVAQGVDFLAADGHKWMLGPEGAGLFYVRSALLDRLRPQQIGWNSVLNPFEYSNPSLELKPRAARFEGGSQNMVGITGLLASLSLLSDCGLASHNSALADRVLEVSDEMVEGLERRGATVHSLRERQHASGIVSFSLANVRPDSARSHLLNFGVVTSCRGGKLRCAVHAYNDSSDVQRLLAAIDCMPTEI